ACGDGEGDPQVESVAGRRGDAVRDETLSEGGVAGCIVRRRRLDPGDDSGVGEQGGHETLEKVTDPGGAGTEPHREAIRRLGVGCGDSQAHVGSEELRHRPHEGPPAVTGTYERVEGRTREQREVI